MSLAALSPPPPAGAARAAPAPPGAGFRPAIHGARGLFALMVVFYHVHNSGLPAPDLPALAEAALASLKFGVELFFAISGYVIVETLRRSESARAFLANRALRIFPMLWLTTTIFLAIAIAGGLPRVTAHMADMPAFSVLVLANFLGAARFLALPVLFQVTWTISFEFAFYLIAGSTEALRRRLGAGAALGAVAIGAALVVLWPRALFFLPGVLVALGWVRWPRGLAAPFLLILVFLCAWQAVALAEIPRFPPLTSWHEPWRFALALLAFLAATGAISALAEGRGWLSFLLQRRWMLWLGTISYSLYLWHTIVIGVVKSGMEASGLTALAGDASQILLLATALPLSLGLSHLTAEWIEIRATRALRRRLA